MENTLDHKTIVNHLLKHHGSKNIKELVLKMSKLFDLTETSIYNKLQNRTNFTARNIANFFFFLICPWMNLYKTTPSIMDLCHTMLTAPNTNHHYSDYINNIIYYYTRVKQLPECYGLLLANEVPLSHLLNFSHLNLPKIYIWNRTNWKMKEFPCIMKVILSTRMKNSNMPSLVLETIILIIFLILKFGILRCW